MLQEPSTADHSTFPDLSDLRLASPISNSPPDIEMDLQTPSPIPAFTSGSSRPDIFDQASPSPIHDALPLPDAAAMRSPSPITGFASGSSVFDMLDQESPSPIQECLPLLGLSSLQSPSPIASSTSGPSITDMFGQASPSPIRDALPLPDAAAMRSPSPIAGFASGSSVFDMLDQESPSPIQECLPLLGLSSLRPASLIASSTSGTYIPDIFGQVSPSPIHDALSLPDTTAMRSPSPIAGSAAGPSVFNMLDQESPSPILDCLPIPDVVSLQSPSSIAILTSGRPARSESPYLVVDPVEPMLLTDINEIRSPSPIASPTSSTDSDEIIFLGNNVPVTQVDWERRIYYTGRTTLLIDEGTLFFWSIFKKHWFAPNQLLRWRKWAQDHRMTIKLAEDLLDFPQRYPELFKSHMRPLCGLPKDDEGRYILPLVEDIKPNLRFTTEVAFESGPLGTLEPYVPDGGAVSTIQSEADPVDSLTIKMEYTGLYSAEVKRAFVRQYHNLRLPLGEEFVNEWQRHLRGAAGIPELRMLETRCITPAIVVSNFETPYPDVPPHPSTNLSHKDSELDDNRNLIKTMRELSSAISDLRSCTSEVFGTARYDRIMRQGRN
ncbi:hypothetical protein QCA50_020550 [Cerrena zonata]|uniref:Uncharacterized protein n=1 Tax=Cerrena zonata TaxID=2478898 RepID=A0AAW0F9B3_9APHY